LSFYIEIMDFGISFTPFLSGGPTLTNVVSENIRNIEMHFVLTGLKGTLGSKIRLKVGSKYNFDGNVYSIDHIFRKTDRGYQTSIDRFVKPKNAMTSSASFNYFLMGARDAANNLCNHRLVEYVYVRDESDPSSKPKKVKKLQECDCSKKIILDFRYLSYVDENSLKVSAYNFGQRACYRLLRIKGEKYENICVACTLGQHSSFYHPSLGRVGRYFKNNDLLSFGKYVKYYEHSEPTSFILYDIIKYRDLGYYVSYHAYLEDSHRHVHIYETQEIFTYHSMTLFRNFIKKCYDNKHVKVPFHFNYPLAQYFKVGGLMSLLAIAIQYLCIVGRMPEYVKEAIALSAEPDYNKIDWFIHDTVMLAVFKIAGRMSKDIRDNFSNIASYVNDEGLNRCVLSDVVYKHFKDTIGFGEYFGNGGDWFEFIFDVRNVELGDEEIEDDLGMLNVDKISLE